jgi:hypothetical protein
VTAESLETKIARRDRYVAAETAILEGAQEYSSSGLRVKRAELPYIQKAIERLNAEIEALQSKNSGDGGASTNKVTFVEPM